MSGIINSSDLDVTSKNDKVENMEAEPPCSSLGITIEKPVDSTSATDSAQEEPSSVENSEGLEEGLTRVAQTCNDQDKPNYQETSPSETNNHKNAKSDNCRLETDLPVQEKQFFEVAEPDVPEQNKEKGDTRTRNGEEKSIDNQQQLERDTPVTTYKQQSSIVIQQDVDDQTEDISHSKLNDYVEKTNEFELEKDTPMESENQLYDYCFSPFKP